MHLLPVTTVSLDEGDQAVDLRQTPGDLVALSFADSDLSALAAAHERDRAGLPSLRLASLKRLRHPLSVDLYVEGTAARSKFVLARCLGGLDYWRFGLERLSAACQASGTKLAVLPGDNRPDSRLAAFSTVPAALADELDAYVRAGGVDNMVRLLRRMAAEIGGEAVAEPPSPVPRAFAWTPERGPEELDAALARLPAGRPLAHLLVYRSAVLAGDTRAVAALADALVARGVATLTLAVSSLKDEAAVAVVRRAIRARHPAVIVAATAFSARDDAAFVLDEADCPVLQAIPVGTARDAWAASQRGLSAADLAMQVALPEFDGRLMAGPISFKEDAPDPDAAFTRRVQAPDPAGVAAVADAALAWVRLARTPRPERRLALILSDYPARGGRAGFAVGLDTPASACAILDFLGEAGYAAERDFSAETLMPRLTEGEPAFSVPLAAYQDWLAAVPEQRRADLLARWGAPEDDPAARGENEFRFRAVRAGRVLVALQPDRGRGGDRKGAYHDPDLPPTHAYLAFYLGLRTQERIDALIHLGTHGTAEWLPGKAVALSQACWPRLAVGATPVVYPFIADDPGEAAPAKRRIGAVTLGHLPPPVASSGLDGETASLRELVEEFSSARVLDPRRADLVARDILERAQAAGLAAEAGVTPQTPMDEALTRLDAHLCDLGEVTTRDGLHVFGN